MLRLKAPRPVAPFSGRRILVLGADLAEQAEAGLPGADVQTGSASELALISRVTCDVLLIDADAWDSAALSGVVQALSNLRSCPSVLLVGSVLPPGLVRNVLRLETSDILEAPFSEDQLAAAVLAVLGEADAQPAPPVGSTASRCWAVTGAVGGAGATTIAIEIANELARRANREHSVCLIDLNLADGATSAYLAATPQLRLAEFGHTPERIDAAMLQAFVTPVTKGLDLVSGVRDPGAFEAAGREAVLRLLEVACDTYDWVVLDMPRHRRSWTLEALAGCDEVLVISELTVPALLAARDLADETERALDGALRPRIVLNRLASRMFGPAPSTAEAEKALQRKADGGVSSDWEAAAASANLGGPVAQHRPKSKIVKDIQMLVERLAAEPARRDAATKAA